MDNKNKEVIPAILVWRREFLKKCDMDEHVYDLALKVAEDLHQSHVITTQEWIMLVKQANASLVRSIPDDD